MRLSTRAFLACAATLLAMPACAQEQRAADPTIARGAYLAIAGDCAACHTSPQGKPFAGGVGIDSPVGRIYSTNITPSKSAGIGNYTLADFDRAVRQGLSKRAGNLYPAMPYTAYAGITDGDISALYAYFMNGVAAVDEAPSARTALPFPFNMRFAMKAWNVLFLDGKPFTPLKGQSDEWNRGAYLAQAFAHCQTCHTPRNLLMGEESGKALSGAPLGGWYAPNITSDKATGIGLWSNDDIVAYLAKGHNRMSQAGGAMLEAVDKSFSKLTEADLRAIVSWLVSVPAIRTAGIDKTSLPKSAVTTDLAVIAGKAEPGAKLYADNCASCHQANGTGRRGLPALDGNAIFTRPTADNLVMAILAGLTPAKGQDMPPFADRMSDDQVAELTNHLFRRYGNAAVQTTPQHVAALRAGGAASNLVSLARIAIALGAVLLLALVVGLLFWQRNRRLHEAA